MGFRTDDLGFRTDTGQTMSTHPASPHAHASPHESPVAGARVARSSNLVTPAHRNLELGEATTANRQPLRVLVAEDSQFLQMVTTALLAAWGITPVLAADGAEAVFLAAGGAYDIILMDLKMPEMDGIEAVHLIRKEERDRLSLERMPIVAYTGDAEVDEAWLSTCGFDAVLRKPCDGPAMEACLTHWCPSSFPPTLG